MNARAEVVFDIEHDAGHLRTLVAELIDSKQYHASELISCGDDRREVQALLSGEFRKLTINALVLDAAPNYEALGRHVVEMALRTFEKEVS
jgi:hypothetical protein